MSSYDYGQSLVLYKTEVSLVLSTSHSIIRLQFTYFVLESTWAISADAKSPSKFNIERSNSKCRTRFSYFPLMTP